MLAPPDPSALLHHYNEGGHQQRAGLKSVERLFKSGRLYEAVVAMRVAHALTAGRCCYRLTGN